MQLDILSLIPLDLLYLKFGTKAVYLRAPRLLKIQSFWELFRLLDRVIASPYLVIYAFLDLNLHWQKTNICFCCDRPIV